MSRMQYVAFLRGINVGGKMVKMEVLRSAFTAVGYINIRTLINSGNVIFEAKEADISAVTQKIEKQLEKSFGFHIDTIIRTMHELQALIEGNPFENIPLTPQTRLYVTFLSGNPKGSLKIPYESPEKDFRILSTKNGMALSTLLLSENRGTVDIMKILEKEFGKKITTRNWNTVQKVVQQAA